MVSGAGLVGCVLRTEAEIQVTTRDSFSNARTDASLLDDVQVGQLCALSEARVVLLASRMLLRRCVVLRLGMLLPGVSRKHYRDRPASAPHRQVVPHPLASYALPQASYAHSVQCPVLTLGFSRSSYAPNTRCPVLVEPDTCLGRIVLCSQYEMSGTDIGYADLLLGFTSGNSRFELAVSLWSHYGMSGTDIPCRATVIPATTCPVLTCCTVLLMSPVQYV
eukprot:3941974-Rhodomonas_salina.2